MPFSRAPMVSALLTAAFVMGAANGALAGDAKHGAVISKRWCASCHVVSTDQTTASADAPAFSEIAQRRPDKKSIARFLIDPHPPMPDMHLSRKEIDDITTYIRSLDPRPQQKEPDGKDEERPKNG